MSPLRGESNDTGEKQKMSEQKNDYKTQNIRFGIGNKQTIANITYDNCVVFCIEGKHYKTNKLANKQIDELFDKGLLKRFCEEIEDNVVDKLTSDEELACLLKDAVNDAIENKGKSLQKSLDDYAKNVIDRLDDIKDKLKGLQETTEKGFKRSDDAHDRHDKAHQELKNILDEIKDEVAILPNLHNQIEEIVRKVIQKELPKTQDPKLRYNEKTNIASYDNQPLEIDIDDKDVVIYGDICNSNIEVKAGGRTTTVWNPRGIGQQQLKLLEQIILLMLIRKVASGEKIDWGLAFAQEAFNMIGLINNQWTPEQESYEDFLLRYMEAVTSQPKNQSGPQTACTLAEELSEKYGIKIEKAEKDEDGNISLVIKDEEVNSEAFVNVHDIKEIEFRKVKRISNGAISRCMALKSVKFPSATNDIGECAIAECDALEELTVARNNTKYRSVNNCVIDIKGHQLVLGCKSSVIPDDGSVLSIRAFAFSGYNGLDIKIPACIETIQDFAFYNCYGTITCDVALQPEGWGKEWQSGEAKVEWQEEQYTQDAVDEKTDNAVAASVDEAEEDQSDSMNIPVEDKYLANYFSDRIGMNVTKILKDENGKYHICISGWHSRIDKTSDNKIENEIVEIEIERGAKWLPDLSGFFNLKKLTLPNTIEAIETSYIAELTSLEEIVIDENNSTYRSVGNCIIKKGTNEIVVIALNGTIPDDGKFFIAQGAFPFENVGCFKIPKSVIGIDKNAFPYAQRGVFFCECADEPDDWQNGWSKSLPVVHDWKNNETANDEHTYYVANDQRVIYALAGGKATVVDVLPGGEVVDELKLSSTICHLNRVYDVDKIACSSLLGVKAKRIVIPQSIKSIDNGAIGTGNVLFEIVAGGKKEELVVDSYLEEIVVDKDNAFYHSKGNCLIEKKGRKLIAGCKNSVIPEDGSVAEIGEYAFAGVELKQITIPDSVQKIGEGAFYCCLNLSSIDIPESIVSIGKKAFYYCHKLGKGDKQKVKIPSSVRTMGRCAFTGFDYTPPIVCEAKRRPSGWDKNWNEEDVPVVWGNNWRRFNFLEGVNNLFIGILLELAGGTALGLSAAYMGCADYILGLLGACFAVFGALGVAACSYADCKTSWTYYGIRLRALKRLMLISGITFVALMLVLGVLQTAVIPVWVFSYLLPCVITIVMVIVVSCLLKKYNATGWNYFVGIASILILAFCCSTFIGGVKVGEQAFFNVDAYYDDGFYLERDNDEVILVDALEDLTEVTIPAEVTSIGDWAFYGCSGLTSITIPFVGEKADGTGSTRFSYIFGYDVPESLKEVIITGGTSIGERAFYECSGLTSITIPDSVTSIGEYAFYECSGLTSITIPDSVTSIGEYAFYECSGLTSITIPDSVTSIGSRAFSGCTGLTSITIPDSVTSIGSNAFRGCSGLTSITIPDSVTSIGAWAFDGCSGLTSITIPDSVISIGDGAFYGCSGLTSLKIPDSVTSIGDWAFDGCSGLTSITIPDSVTSIGYEAFSGCSGLTSITIPDSVTSIGSYAFYNCSNLIAINFQGTMEQWRAIDKYYTWDNSTHDFSVICTDGTISKADA